MLRDIHESQIKQLKNQIDELHHQLSDAKNLHQNQIKTMKENAEQKIQEIILQQKESKQQNDLNSSVQLSELKNKLQVAQDQILALKQELQQKQNDLIAKSQKIEHLQLYRSNQKIFEQSYLKMQQNLTLLTNQKNQTQQDMVRWKKDALALQEKLQKSQKQTQAGIKLAKQVPDIEKLKSQIIFLQKEKQLEKEVMSAEYQNLIKEVNEIKIVIGANRSYIARLEQQVRSRDSQIKILRETLRSFTSCKDMDFDQTFEAVLKAEFDVMKSSFLKQINQLNKIIEKDGKEFQNKLRDAQKQKQELKIKISSLTSRISYFKNSGADSKN